MLPTLLDYLRIFLAPQSAGGRNDWDVIDSEVQRSANCGFSDRLNHLQPESEILSNAIRRIAAQIHHFTTKHYGGVVEKPDFRGVPLVFDVLVRDLLRCLVGESS